MKSFDLIVIGAGSGLDVAVQAAQQGLKTAIIEEGPLGGTCLNRGCIPSKMIIHAADVAEEIRNSAVFGVHGRISRINFPRITSRASVLVDADARSIEQALRQGKNPILFRSRAKFVAPHTLQVGRETVTGKKIVIAAGARPFIPPIPGLQSVPYMTSTEALRRTKLPKKLMVIGGGYIGAELGHFYAALGSRVTILQRGPLLLSREDKDVAELFTRLWKKRHGIFCNCAITKVEKKGSIIIVHGVQGGRAVRFIGDALLVATGIRPNTDTLDVAKAGINVNERGFIAVNTFMETSVKNIWALGDIAGVYLFKHAANLEVEYVLHNLLGKGSRKAVDYYPMPHAIFTHPQIAGVGLTEEECREQKKQYLVGRYEYRNTGMGAALEEKDGFVKLLVDRKSREILGCHIIGPDASTLIHEVVVAMKADRTRALQILQEAVHVHPALSEVVQRAALSVPL